MPAPTIEIQHADYTISTDRSRIDTAVVHRYLSEEAYWAIGRSFDLQEKAIANSLLVAGAYSQSGAQVGFARMVTDLATWAWLCDVFVLPDHQGLGIGGAIVKTIVEHPVVVGIGTQFLATGTAHGLYTKFGYTPLDDPGRWMHRRP